LNPDRVVMIFEADDPGEHFQPGQLNLSSVRLGTFQDWREQSHSFTSMAAIQNTRATILDADRSSVVDGYRVGDEFFETLGVPARLGRTSSRATSSATTKRSWCYPTVFGGGTTMQTSRSSDEKSYSTAALTVWLG
jgi:hypothetical protein